MAKKGDIVENKEEIEPPAEPVKEPIKPPVKEPVNIMSTDDAHEPPKAKKQKQETIAEAVDLSPVLEKIDEGFKQLTDGLVPKTPKKEEKKFEENFLGPLGDW